MNDGDAVRQATGPPIRTQVESENRAAAAKQKASTGRGGGWFGWVRGGGGGGTKTEEPSELSEEDRQKIMALVTEQEDALQPGADALMLEANGLLRAWSVAVMV